jgi:sterol desaturase/sphingolipid hydroxylase (fatty acid hydroxylase superfamily)
MPIGAAVLAAEYVLAGPYYSRMLYAGTVLGYITYDWMHYYTHHFMPKSRAGKFIKRYHMLHHHDSPGHRYGITSPLWDFVFGTYVPTRLPAARLPADARRRALHGVVN